MAAFRAYLKIQPVLKPCSQLLLSNKQMVGQPNLNYLLCTSLIHPKAYFIYVSTYSKEAKAKGF